VVGLSSEQLGQIIDTLVKNCPRAIHEESEDDIDIEVSLIDADTLKQLIKYATSFVNSWTIYKEWDNATNIHIYINEWEATTHPGIN